MKAYSIDLREKIVLAYFLDNLSIRKTAEQFSVAKSFVQKLVKQQKNERTLEPKKVNLKSAISQMQNQS
jgi:transposase